MGQIGVNCQTYSQIGVRLFSHSNLVNFIVLIYGYTGRNYFEIIASLSATASSLKTPHLYVFAKTRSPMEEDGANVECSKESARGFSCA